MRQDATKPDSTETQQRGQAGSLRDEVAVGGVEGDVLLVDVELAGKDAFLERGQGFDVTFG
jgi:hypothetical protein